MEIFNNLGAIPHAPCSTRRWRPWRRAIGEQIAYDALVRQMLRIELDKSSRFTDWARRPLSEAQLTYAAADVTHLAQASTRKPARAAGAGGAPLLGD